MSTVAQNTLQDSEQRALARDAFLAASLGKGPTAVPMPADASFRRYFRVRNAQSPLLLMDAPPGLEDVGRFLRIADHLVALGFSAPQILHRDEHNGFLLIEDFGDSTYTRLLAQGFDEAALYELAIDTLIALQRRPDVIAIALPDYDMKTFVDEALLLVDWYLPSIRGQRLSDVARTEYIAVWHEVYSRLPVAEATLVLRDFHVDNLMRVAGREGVAACGLLDFQDALRGPTAYDVLSLLEDARRDIAPALIERMLARYRKGMELEIREWGNFLTWYDFVGAQRHAKVLGIFVRLSVRDGKDVYLGHLPRVARLFRQRVAAPSLLPVRRWLEAHVPEFPLCESDAQR